MDDLLIPYARNLFDAYVAPHDAFRGEIYFCPQCGEEVTLREGAKVRVHFAHKPNSECTGESIEHIVAKEWLRQAALDKKPKYLTCLVCCKCGGNTELLFPGRFAGATVETEWIGTRRPDVMLRTISGKFAVEVYRSHAVNESKAADLLGVPWFEVTAESILADAFVWKCTQSNLVVECPACAHESQSLKEIEELIGSFPLECKLSSCRYCGKETPFLIGNLDDLWPWSPYVHKYFTERRKDKRSKRTVTRFSVRNKCVHCGRMQPEFYPGRSALAWARPYATLGTTVFGFKSSIIEQAGAAG